MDPQSKRPRVGPTLPPLLSRIVQAPDDSAVDLCVDVFNRLVQNSVAPDRGMFFGLVYVAKARAALFRRPELASVLIKFLQSAKAADALLSLLACNLLLRGYASVAEWPMDFVQVFLMDSFQGRHWVDHELAAGLVAGISTAFSPRSPTRYSDPAARTNLELIITGHLVRENIDRTDNVKGLVRALTTLCSYPTVRLLAAEKMAKAAWLQDGGLSRYAKELFVMLCATTVTSLKSDLDALATLVTLPQGNLPPSFLHENRTRLLANNPEYPMHALSVTLVAAEGLFSSDALKGAFDACPNEVDASRVVGQKLFACAVDSADTLVETVVRRALHHLPRLHRQDCAVGFLEAGLPAPPASVARFITGWTLVCPEQHAEPAVVRLLRELIRSGQHALVAPGSPMWPAIESGVFARVQTLNEDLCDALVWLCERVPPFRDHLAPLVLRVASVAIATESAGARLVERLLAFGEINAVVLLAIRAPQQCGQAAIQSEAVRFQLAQIVSNQLPASHWSGVARTQLQLDACRSRSPDFVVLTLEQYPADMDSCPAWLARLAADDAGSVTGLGSTQSMRLLVATLVGGPSHPFAQHSAMLAAQVRDGSWDAMVLAMDKFVHPRSLVRAAAQHALSLVLGPEWFLNPLFRTPEHRDAVSAMCQRSFAVETDVARIRMVEQLAPPGLVNEYALRRRAFRGPQNAPTVDLRDLPVRSSLSTDWAALLGSPPPATPVAARARRSFEALPRVHVANRVGDAQRATDLALANECRLIPMLGTPSGGGLNQPARASDLVRNARLSLMRGQQLAFLAEAIIQRYSDDALSSGVQRALAPPHPHQWSASQGAMYGFDLCGAERQHNYARILTNRQWLLDRRCADMVVAEWKTAVTHVDSAVVSDAVARASVLYVSLATNDQRAQVREFLVRRHGPRVAADMLRAYLVAGGYA